MPCCSVSKRYETIGSTLTIQSRTTLIAMRCVSACRCGRQMSEFVNSVEQGVDEFKAIGQLVLDFARKVKDQPFFARVVVIAERALEVADMVGDMVDKVQTYLDVAQRVLDVDNLADELKQEVDKLLGKAVANVNAIVDVLVAKLEGVVDRAAATLFGLVDKVEAFVLDGITNVVAFVKDELAPYASVVFRVREMVTSFLDVISNGIDFTALAGWVKDQLQQMVDLTLNVGVVDPILDAFDDTVGVAMEVRSGCSNASVHHTPHHVLA